MHHPASRGLKLQFTTIAFFNGSNCSALISMKTWRLQLDTFHAITLRPARIRLNSTAFFQNVKKNKTSIFYKSWKNSLCPPDMAAVVAKFRILASGQWQASTFRISISIAQKGGVGVVQVKGCRCQVRFGLKDQISQRCCVGMMGGDEDQHHTRARQKMGNI